MKRWHLWPSQAPPTYWPPLHPVPHPLSISIPLLHRLHPVILIWFLCLWSTLNNISPSHSSFLSLYGIWRLSEASCRRLLGGDLIWTVSFSSAHCQQLTPTIPATHVTSRSLVVRGTHLPLSAVKVVFFPLFYLNFFIKKKKKGRSKWLLQRNVRGRLE